MAIEPTGSAFNKSGMTIKFNVPATANLRGERGQFRAQGMKEMRARNQQIGAHLRAQVGQRMESHIMRGRRASASSGRLLQVTMADDNVRVTQWSVGVGDIKYLNNSTAKYWRTFEEGSLAVWRRPFVGTQLVARYKAPFTRGVPSPHGTSLFTAKGNVTFKHSGSDDMFVVKHEIAPAHIYRDVFREAHLSAEGLQSARRFIDRIFNTPIGTFPFKNP